MAIEYVRLEREHLTGVVKLFEAEGWASYTEDPATTWRALTAPGSVVLVAVEDGAVVGIVQMLSDGVIQAFMTVLIVAPECRRRGVGRRLVEEAFARCGARRVDLSTDDETGDFYRTFRHRELRSFRLYPGAG